MSSPYFESGRGLPFIPSYIEPRSPWAWDPQESVQNNLQLDRIRKASQRRLTEPLNNALSIFQSEDDRQVENHIHRGEPITSITIRIPEAYQPSMPETQRIWDRIHPKPDDSPKDVMYYGNFKFGQLSPDGGTLTVFPQPGNRVNVTEEFLSKAPAPAPDNLSRSIPVQTTFVASTGRIAAA